MAIRLDNFERELTRYQKRNKRTRKDLGIGGVNSANALPQHIKYNTMRNKSTTKRTIEEREDEARHDGERSYTISGSKMPVKMPGNIIISTLFL
jgi:hypothetical protein